MGSSRGPRWAGAARRGSGGRRRAHRAELERGDAGHLLAKVKDRVGASALQRQRQRQRVRLPHFGGSRGSVRAPDADGVEGAGLGREVERRVEGSRRRSARGCEEEQRRGDHRGG